MNIKKLLCILFCVVFVFAFAACKDKKEDNTSSISSDTVSTPTKIVTIGKTTVKEIAEKLEKLEFSDDFKLSVTDNRINEEYSSVRYTAVDSEGKELATLSIGSDLENKAANLSFSWNYAENDAELNQKILSGLKSIFPAIWPGYNDDNYKTLEQNFKLETDYIDRFIDINITEASPSSDSSAFVSLSVSSGMVTFSIRYPDVVENV